MVAAAASPSPAPAPHAADGRPHPTYTKMITHALTELGGASARPGIAEYILGRFSGLPARHNDLLSAHLRRLVSEGVIRTHGPDSLSYIFDPPPPPPPASEQKRGPGRPRKDSDASTPHLVPLVPVGTQGEKRGRGRPRKNPVLFAHTCAPSLLPAKRKLPGEDVPSVTKRGPGRPATHQSAHIQAGMREAVGGQETKIFQNGGDSTPVWSGGGIKRGPGRPRKEKPLEAAAAMSSEPGNAALTVVKRGPGRPRKEKPSQEAQYPTAGSAAAMSPESRNAASTGRGRGRLRKQKRGRGRPRKEKPSEEAQSPTAGSVATASRGFKRGCGRPSMGRPSAAAAAASYEHGVAASLGIKTGGETPRKDKPAAAAISAETSMEKLAAAAAAAMYAETGGDTAASVAMQAGGGQSKFEKLAEEVVAMSANRGGGTPTKDKPAVPAGVKRSRGRPRKDQCITGLVEAAVEELVRDMMTKREEEDFVSVDKLQTGEGVAPGDRNEIRAAAMSAEGGDAVSAGIGAGDGTPRMEESSAARSPETADAASTGVKRKRGRPRKEKSAAATMPSETGNAASTVVKRGRGRPRMEVSRSREIKRPRGRPRKNPAAATSANTGDAVSTAIKRGRGRPRKKEQAPPAEGNRSCPPASLENAQSSPADAVGYGLGYANL